MRRHSSSGLGFFPAARYNELISKDRMLCIATYEDPCIAYIIWTKVAQTIKIHGIAVAQDYRRNGLGTLLIQSIEKLHAKENCDLIQLRCREDLEANHFWPAAGFELMQNIAGNNVSNKTINVYVRPVCPINTSISCTLNKNSLNTPNTTQEVPRTWRDDSASMPTAEPLQSSKPSEKFNRNLSSLKSGESPTAEPPSES